MMENPHHRIKRCLILGGRGFIGSHLVDALLKCRVPVRVFARARSSIGGSYVDNIKNDKLEIFEGDFSSESDLRTALDGCSHCVNLITATIPKSSNEDMIFDIESNLVGTVRLLKYAKSSGIEKLVYISSGGTVYGSPKYLPLDEKHPTEPQSSYGITKLAAEKYSAIFDHLFDFKTTVLRIANPFGERQRSTSSHGAIAVFIRKALLNESIHIWGDGTVTRDYFYVADCVTAIIQALNYNGNAQIFNIGSGIGRDLASLTVDIGTILGCKIDVVYEPSRAFDVPKNILDIKLARDVLNWSPKTEFKHALQRTIAWQKLEL